MFRFRSPYLKRGLYCLFFLQSFLACTHVFAQDKYILEIRVIALSNNYTESDSRGARYRIYRELDDGSRENLHVADKCFNGPKNATIYPNALLKTLTLNYEDYAKPFKLLSVTHSNQTVTLRWESVIGQPYRVESSTNLMAWTVLATNLVATNSTFTYATNLSDAVRFFRIYPWR